jgi:hypothetical protein
VAIGFIQVLGQIECGDNRWELRMKQEKSQKANSEMSLDEDALRYLAKNGVAGVPELYDALRVRNPALTKAEVVDLLSRLAAQGKADLEDVPPATRSLGEYLKHWERNLCLYGSLMFSLATVLVIYAVPSELPYEVLRWVLGSVFVFFIPGYVTVEALFPKSSELDSIERIALSIGLSLALVPLVALLLNYTPWGIRLTPIITSLTALTIGLTMIALAREYRFSFETGRSKSVPA